MKTFEARYTRISTQSQSEIRQTILNVEGEKLFSDICSGSIPFSERPQGKKLIEAVENGLVSKITFHACDRAGRSTLDVINTLTYFYEKGVNVRIENLGLESVINGKKNPMFGMITMLLAEVSQLEKQSLLERQKEGIAIAKAKALLGNKVYKGRVLGSTDSKEITLNKYKNVIKVLKQFPQMSLRQVAQQCSNDNYKVSANTVKKVKALIG